MTTHNTPDSKDEAPCQHLHAANYDPAKVVRGQPIEVLGDGRMWCYDCETFFTLHTPEPPRAAVEGDAQVSFLEAVTQIIEANCERYRVSHNARIAILNAVAAAASPPAPAEKLTPLQQAMVEHDDDMARLDRNTLAHIHCWHERVDAASYCCGCEDLPHAPAEPLQPTGEPSLEDLALEAASLLDKVNVGGFGLLRGAQQTAFALRARVASLRAATPPTIPSDAAMRAAEGVKRFSHTYEDGIWCMDERPDGKWVRYSDIAAIITRHLAADAHAIRVAIYDWALSLADDRLAVVTNKDIQSLADRLIAATTSPETPVGGEQLAHLPRLPFICGKCNVQQHAGGICANCGANALRTQPSALKREKESDASRNRS